jgi:hypothetical protein
MNLLGGLKRFIGRRKGTKRGLKDRSARERPSFPTFADRARDAALSLFDPFGPFRQKGGDIDGLVLLQQPSLDGPRVWARGEGAAADETVPRTAVLGTGNAAHVP